MTIAGKKYFYYYYIKEPCNFFCYYYYPMSEQHTLILRSGELAEEYKHLKDEMVKAEEKASSDFDRHRMVMMDLRDCKMDIKKEKEYMETEKECVSPYFLSSFTCPWFVFVFSLNCFVVLLSGLVFAYFVLHIL